MFERFRKDSRAVVLDAMKEARVRADARIEAEHLLLALARRSTWDAGRVLADAGIDHDGLRAALDDEVRHTLEAVGVGSGATWIPASRCRSRVNRGGASRRRWRCGVRRSPPRIAAIVSSPRHTS